MDNIFLKVVKHPEKIVYGLERKGLLDWLSEKDYIKITYRLAFGRKLNLDNPKALTEKINWYKLYYRDPLMRKCVDKYEVRQYVRESIGDAYLNECFGVWNSIDEIDYDALPNQFVLKPTNGSGDIVICKNKSNFNWEEAKKTLTKYSKRSFATKTKEWNYCYIHKQAEQGQKTAKDYFRPAKPTPSIYDSDLKRVAVYARVSTSSEEQISSIENQTLYYTKKIAETENWNLQDIYSDEGKSGTSLRKRDAFKRMMRDAKDQKMDLIICASISRFARNFSDCMTQIAALKMIGAIPSRNEVQRELDDLLMSM